MTKNTHTVDRMIRVAVGIAAFTGAFAIGGGILSILLGVVGFLLFGTAAISFCPFYAVVGFSTLALGDEDS